MPAFSVKKPLTVYVVALAILILGVVAYLKMTPDLMPNMDYPYMIVVTSDPGASPESVEEEITKPLEKALATLDQLKTIQSSSQNSVSTVVLEFENGANMDSLGIDVQQKVSAVQGQWDDSISSPYILKVNPSMIPVMVAAISSSNMDVYELSDFVDDELAAKLTGITGVASVDVVGTINRETHVVLDAEKMAAVTKMVREKAGRELDKAAGKLKNAKKELQEAQSALDEGIAQAADGVADGVTGILNQAADALRDAIGSVPDGDDLITEEEKALRDAILADQQQMAANNEKIQANQAIIDDENATEEEKAAAAAENLQLQAENQMLALRINENTVKLNAMVAQRQQQQMSQSIKAMQKALQEIEAFLNDPHRFDELNQQLSAGTRELMDGMLLMTESNVQIKLALQQIEEGEKQLAETRRQVLEQLDMDGILSVSMVQQLLTAQDFSMPAGYIDDEDGVSYMVSVSNEITETKELENMVLFDLGIDGVEPIRLNDVATVFYTDNADQIYAKLNGENGIIASFTKQSNYATAEVSDNITARLEQLTGEYDGLSFKPLMDQGDYIHLIVETILSSLMWGALFSVVVLFVFLRDWRPTLITLISIPASVIFAVVLMYFTGVTINMISLSGLLVAVGMLVDNSVVVIENIYRLRARGATVVQAAVSGAQQVLGAIAASTLTTVCVFAPIVFVEGLTRELFTDLALTMTYSLLASLLVALTLVPAMASGMLRRPLEQRAGLLDKLYPAYRRAVVWSLDHKAAVLAGSLALLVLTGIVTVGRGFSFMPDMDMNSVSVTVSMPEQCTRQEAVRYTDEVARRCMTVDGVNAVGATIQADTALTLMSADVGEYDAQLYITLPDNYSGTEAGREIEKLCADMDCTVTADNVMSGMMSYVTGSGVSLNVYCEDMETLQSTAQAIAARMEQVEGTENVSDGLEDAAQALRVTIDRTKAMEHGMTVAQIYMQIASALTSSTAGTDMVLDDTSMQLIIEQDEASRLTYEKLPELKIDPNSAMSAAFGTSGTSGASGGSLSGDGDTDKKESFLLKDVATVEKTVSLNTISRDQQRRCVTVTAGIAEGKNVTLVSSEVTKAVQAMTLPDGVTIEFNGENEQIMKAMGQVMLMMLLGVVLVYFVMVAQFQSLREPFIVMFTIPLAFTGGFMALLLSGTELSVISLIGFVMLVGIIVNNGIVLVDCINQQRLAGMERREAVIDAGVTRLRPILMTSLTTILGLIVTALAKNAGTSLIQPVALVCIGGLLYATLMTLFVVPCMYELVSKKKLHTVDEKELELLKD